MQSWRYSFLDTLNGILNLFLEFFFMALKNDDALQNISVAEGAAVKSSVKLFWAYLTH